MYLKKEAAVAGCLLVRMVRVELTRAIAHYPLKVACLPFHHIRSLFWDCKGNNSF